MIPTEYFENQRDFCAVISIANALFAEGLITLPEYRNIKNGFIKEYDPPIKLIGNKPVNFQPKSLEMT